MTFILKLDLGMVRMYLHTKNEVSMSCSSKVIVCTDGHTDKQTDRQTDRHDRKHYLLTYAGGSNRLEILSSGKPGFATAILLSMLESVIKVQYSLQIYIFSIDEDSCRHVLLPPLSICTVTTIDLGDA